MLRPDLRDQECQPEGRSLKSFSLCNLIQVVSVLRWLIGVDFGSNATFDRGPLLAAEHIYAFGKQKELRKEIAIPQLHLRAALYSMSDMTARTPSTPESVKDKHFNSDPFNV